MTSTLQLISNLQQRINAGAIPSVAELRDGTWQAMRFLAFSVTSGDVDQLGALSGEITQTTEAYFEKLGCEEEVSREWARSLAVLGQLAVALYESMGPTLEARRILGRSQHAKNVARILLSRGTVQARELRDLAKIPHQPTLARIIHTLANARVVAVEHGAGNSAWYRLTPEGRNLLSSAILVPSDVGIQTSAERSPQIQTTATGERMKQLVHELAALVEDRDMPSKGPAKDTESVQRGDSIVLTR
jgi:hypothetical protein